MNVKKTIALTCALAVLAGCSGGSGASNEPAPKFGSKAGPRQGNAGGAPGQPAPNTAPQSQNAGFSAN